MNGDGERGADRDAAGDAGAGPGDRLLWVALGLALCLGHLALLEGRDGAPAAAPSLDEALYDPGVSSPGLGWLVFGFLIFVRRARIASALGAPSSPRVALPCLGLGLALLAWSHAIDATDLVLPALVLELAGGAAWLGGTGLLRAAAFPLLALVSVISLPPMLINALVFPLQLRTVWLASGLLDLVGRAHLVAGDLILTQGVAFRVIEGCSGLKTILSLVLASVAYAELVGRRGGEKLLIVALAPLVGFLANGLRVLVLVLRAVPAESVEHDAYGVAAVVAGVVLLAAAELALSRTVFRHRERPGAEPAPAGAPPDRGRLRARVATWAGATLAVCGFSLATPAGAWKPRPARVPDIEALPLALAGREAQGIVVDDAFLGRVRFAHRLYRAYEEPATGGGADRAKGIGAVRVFVGLPDDTRRDESAISPKTVIPRSGWLELERLGRERSTDGERERVRLRYDAHLTGERAPDPARDRELGGRAGATVGSGTLVEQIRLGFAPWEVELVRAWLGLAGSVDRAASPPPPRLVIRVEVDWSGDRAAAELRLRQFAQEVVDWYRSAG